MKQILTLIICCVSLNVWATDTQTIINPINGQGVWDLTQENCPYDAEKGVIRIGGRMVGCWSTNPVAKGEVAKTVWFEIDNQVYSFPAARMVYAQSSYGVPWQVLQSILNTKSAPTPEYHPPVVTNYYGANGVFVGQSYSY
jgi:hypothetical protein